MRPAGALRSREVAAQQQLELPRRPLAERDLFPRLRVSGADPSRAPPGCLGGAGSTARRCPTGADTDSDTEAAQFIQNDDSRAARQDDPPSPPWKAADRTDTAKERGAPPTQADNAAGATASETAASAVPLRKEPIGPRIRPSSAAAAGSRAASSAAPRPEHVAAAAVACDNDIARLSAAEARDLVALLEHKLRVARQTVLIRALNPGQTNQS